MKIAIIGAGYTGLAAAWKLAKLGHRITVFESQKYPGGLAAGFTAPNWSWTLEHHYHHIFTSDHDIINLTKELDFSDQIIFHSALTSIIYDHHIYPFDSPLSLLQFPHLSPMAKFRTAATLGFLKLTPSWKQLEKVSAQSFISKASGRQSWDIVWQPLFSGKFGSFSSQINAAWFWARIKVRSKQLGYFKKGFQHFANHFASYLSTKGVIINYSNSIKDITLKSSKIAIQSHQKTKSISDNFDKVLVAAPSPVLVHLIKSLPKSYISRLSKLKGLAAQTLILELDQPFFQDGTYWLNINQKNWPFLAVVEHTNFIPVKHYGHKHILYIGRYLSSSDKNLKKNPKQLIQEYKPYLTKLSPHHNLPINKSWVFTSPFAQPVVPINHSKQLPEIKTPIKNVYWASMQHIYPFDRGVNYAVRLGNKAADTMIDD